MISLILIFGFLCQSSIFRYPTTENLDVHGELIIGILVSLVVGHLNVVLQLQLLPKSDVTPGMFGRLVGGVRDKGEFLKFTRNARS